jgi:soluble lytic murein transglycosylase
MKMRLNIALLGVATLLGIIVCDIASAASRSHGDPAEQAFLVARDAFRERDPIKLARVAPRAKGYLLEPYVEQWLLRLKLDDASPEEVRDFLARYPGTLLAEQVRSDWLKLLGKRGEWDLFRQERPKLVNADDDIACYSLLERSLAGDASTLAGLAPLWLSARDLPAGCDTLAGQAIAGGGYGSREIWQRFRVLAEAGRISSARKLLKQLPDAEAPKPGLRAFGKKIDRVLRSPIKYLLQLPEELHTRAGRELALLALSRIAKSEPQAAADRFTEGLRDELSPADQGYVWGLIATIAARRHMPEALDWFAEARDADLTDEQRAWHARSALRAGDWEQVLAAIDRMSEQGRGDDAWVYWRARALKATAHAAEAEPLFQRIAGEASFYGQLAADELSLPFSLPPEPAPITSDEMAQAQARPGLQRALALFRLEMRTEGVREWNWAIRGMGDRQLIAAAELARRNEIWDRAINTADRTVAVHDFSLRYLAPHFDLFKAQARARSLEEHWVLGLVRQESRFISFARSAAGASGMMQLMPSTARWVARKMGIKHFSLAKVNTIDMNAALGTFYLKHILDDLNGKPILASAAYNAGPGRARKWMGDSPMEGAIYIESIPFSETRDYVKKVMTNTLYYAAVHGGDPRSLKARLGTIGPSASIASTDTP